MVIALITHPGEVLRVLLDLRLLSLFRWDLVVQPVLHEVIAVPSGMPRRALLGLNALGFLVFFLDVAWLIEVELALLFLGDPLLHTNPFLEISISMKRVILC